MLNPCFFFKVSKELFCSLNMFAQVMDLSLLLEPFLKVYNLKLASSHVHEANCVFCYPIGSFHGIKSRCKFHCLTLMRNNCMNSDLPVLNAHRLKIITNRMSIRMLELIHCFFFLKSRYGEIWSDIVSLVRTWPALRCREYIPRNL